MNLEEENRYLRTQIEQYERIATVQGRLFSLFSRLSVLVVAGPGLTKSTIDLLGALRKGPGEFPTIEAGTFLAALIRRLTTFGVIAFFVAILPILLLWQQNQLIGAQIPLLAAQIDQIRDQTTTMREQTSNSIEQVKLLQKQISASVRPVLEAQYSSSNEADLRVALESSGLGPAIVKNVELHLLNARVESMPTYRQYATLKSWSTKDWPDTPIFVDAGFPTPGSAISVGSRYSALQVDNRLYKQLRPEQRKLVVCNLPKDLVIRIEYCSTADDCEIASSENNSAHPECPIKPTLK